MSYDGCKAEERIGNSSEKVQEINYCKLINSNLPPFIQVIGNYSYLWKLWSNKMEWIFGNNKKNEIFQDGHLYLDQILVRGNKLKNFFRYSVYQSAWLKILHHIPGLIAPPEHISTIFQGEILIWAKLMKPVKSFWENMTLGTFVKWT